MGDFNAQIEKRTNPMERATGTFGLELRNERGDTLRHRICVTIFSVSGIIIIWYIMYADPYVVALFDVSPVQSTI